MSKNTGIGKLPEGKDSKRKQDMKEPIREPIANTMPKSNVIDKDVNWQVTVPFELNKSVNSKRFPGDRPKWRRYFKTKAELICSLLREWEIKTA